MNGTNYDRGPEKRPATDIHPKVAWGGAAGLIVAGLLAALEAHTGVPVPDGLDVYIVALVAALAGYLKKGDGR